jgi:hypothetical protein
MWRIEFSSAEFLPSLPEDCQANPGVYGFELALWLSQTLAQRSIITSYPLKEDWGWLIEYVDGQLEVMVGCSSMAEQGEGYTGKPVSWSIFARSHQSLKSKLFGGRNTTSVPSKLTEAIAACLKDKGIAFEQVEV